MHPAARCTLHGPSQPPAAPRRPQTFAAITARCPTKSTWSIDLAYLLHGYGVAANYYTITWGANESYKSIDYYKENLDSDASRVNELFRMAKSRGMHVEMRSVEMPEILSAIARESSVIIILVDTQMFENGCTEAGERMKKRRHEAQSGGGGGGVEQDLVGARLPHSLPSHVDTEAGFVGHYVVLIRYLENDGLVEVADPGVGLERRIIGEEALDKARKAHGTDEDLLIIDVGTLTTQSKRERSGADGEEGGRRQQQHEAGAEAGGSARSTGRSTAGRNQRARPT